AVRLSISFLESWGWKRQPHNCLRIDDRRRGNTLIAVSPCDEGPRARGSRRQASSSHPFAHAAHDVVFDLDDLRSSKRGGPINKRSRQTMNHPEHARTGTSAVGGSRQVATSLGRGRPT